MLTFPFKSHTKCNLLVRLVFCLVLIFHDLITYLSVLQAGKTTFVMFWHFKPMWAAVLMLHYRGSCSTKVSRPGVSLNCTEKGAAPAVNCTINLALPDCMGELYMWKDFEGNDICNSGDYECEWDNQTYVSLVITKAAKCEPYEIFIDTTCGMTHSEISVTHCGDGELLQLCINFLRKNLHWLQLFFESRSTAYTAQRSSGQRAARLSCGDRLSGDLHPPFRCGGSLYFVWNKERQSQAAKFNKCQDNQSPGAFPHLRCALEKKKFVFVWLCIFCACMQLLIWRFFLSLNTWMFLIVVYCIFLDFLCLDKLLRDTFYYVLSWVRVRVRWFCNWAVNKMCFQYVK